MQCYITKDWNAIFFVLNIPKSALLFSWVEGKNISKRVATMSETTANSWLLSSSQAGTTWSSGNDIFVFANTQKGKDCCLFLRQFKSQRTSVHTPRLYLPPLVFICASSHLTTHDLTLFKFACCCHYQDASHPLQIFDWCTQITENPPTNFPTANSNASACRKNGLHATRVAEINRTSQETDALNPVASKTSSIFEFSKTQRPTGKIKLPQPRRFNQVIVNACHSMKFYSASHKMA